MQNQTTIIKIDTKATCSSTPLVFNSRLKEFEVATTLSPVFKSENSKEWPQFGQSNIEVTNSPLTSSDHDNTEFEQKIPTTFSANPFVQSSPQSQISCFVPKSNQLQVPVMRHQLSEQSAFAMSP